MYSCSKSFTATAVGFAVNEKLLSLSDKVISFFPDQLPDTISDNLKALTVKDVLSMSDGQDPDPTFTVASRDTNWVKSFLTVPILYKPGSTFLYNSLGTYMLSAIVQKVTGQKIIDYLTPRLFTPLGITGMDWEVDPKGINTGGWGLRIKTEDMAKFGQLFLQKGKWNGKQVLPESWVKEASTLKIVQHPEYSKAKRDSSDWEQGYCYQMWRCRHNAYRGDGAYGQFIIVLPEEDAVIAITAETLDMQTELNLVWDYLLPAFHKGALQENAKASAKLQQQLARLALPVPAKNNIAAAVSNFSKTFSIESNANHVQSIAFSFNNGVCEVKIGTDTAVHQLSFAAGNWQLGETPRHGPSLVEAAKASFVSLPAFKIAGAYTFKDEHTIELTLRYIESPHTERMTCHIDGDTINITVAKSLDFGSKVTELKGRVE